MTLEKQMREMSDILLSIGDQIKDNAIRSMKEIDRHGEMLTSTKETVDKLMTEQGELSTKLRTTEQLIAKLESGNTSAKEKMTIGQYVANRPEVMSYSGGKVIIDVSAAAVGDAVTRQDKDGASIVAPHFIEDIKSGPYQRLSIRDLLNWGTTSSDSVQFVREHSFANNAGIVDENPSDPKPKSKLTFELDTAPVVTIAHWIPASKQILRDKGQVRAYIDNRLRYGLALVEETQLLLGSGSGGDLHGIYTQATNYASVTGTQVKNENPLDRLRLAILKAELTGYVVDGIVLNPIDWANIEMLKDTTNAYLFGYPTPSPAKTLWGRRVVDSVSLTKNKFLVGAFALGAQVWDRQTARVAVAEQHEDFFTRNMVAILAEEDITLTVFRPDAFIKGDLPSIITT